MADILGDPPIEQDIDMIDAPPNSEMLVIDEIDPAIMEHEPRASPVEELESFSVDLRDPSKVLKSLPKDSFLLPRIDQLVDSRAGHELLSFMGRLLKWAVELSEFDLVFKARAAIKEQALADFVAEFANLPEVDEIMEPAEPPMWNLFVDGSAGHVGSGVGVVLINPEVHKLTSIVRFGFKATSNAAEYEALLPGLRLATKVQIPRIKNAHADALSKLASSKDSELLTVVPIEHLLLPSIEAPTRSFSSPLQRCVGREEATYILRKIHEGVCGNHSGGVSLAQKILRQGYYWPTLKRDALEFVQKCDKCQRFSPVQRQPSQDLITVSSPWPLSKWGVDLIGPLPKGRGGASFAFVSIDYFTKWVKAEPLAKITEANISKFLWKNIICRFRILHSIVSDNGRQKLDVSKRAWVDELPQVLWAIRTTTRTPTGEMPFLMAFETEAMSPVEVGLPSPRRLHFSEITNDELRRLDLDFIDERRDDAQLNLGTYQRKMTRYFNSKVKKRSFRINDLVLKRVFQSSKELGSSSLGLKWEGPYKIKEELFIRLIPRVIQFIRVHSLKFEAHSVVHSLKSNAHSVVHSRKSKAHTIIKLK
ncbi:uncharacterized protein LOC111411189 [Olea europaea var. sylvestris]|uniref:uncharacterized protein LOC111411189 n=1 Tax=Olea europaea var. sylvestris TaxID=158386 RepID=UPI000C1CDC23|nr:uncharacterized protein LOC111411189 [Olea europaea var. sylvestris]